MTTYFDDLHTIKELGSWNEHNFERQDFDMMLSSAFLGKKDLKIFLKLAKILLKNEIIGTFIIVPLVFAP